MVNYIEKDRTVVCSLNTKIYSLDVIMKCFYWYNNDYTTIVEPKKHDIVQVKLEKKKGEIDSNLYLELRSKIYQDLIDFKARDIVSKETKTIRELLIAKAFSNLEED